jgi:hypothetical protein
MFNVLRIRYLEILTRLLILNRHTRNQNEEHSCWFIGYILPGLPAWMYQHHLLSTRFHRTIFCLAFFPVIVMLVGRWKG